MQTPCCGKAGMQKKSVAEAGKRGKWMGPDKDWDDMGLRNDER